MSHDKQAHQQPDPSKFGFAGQLAAKFQNNALTPLLAIVVGADSDNTGNRSTAYVGDLTLVKQ
mgnify:CR=1 FL=1